jgi:hypothetical protein
MLAQFEWAFLLKPAFLLSVFHTLNAVFLFIQLFYYQNLNGLNFSVRTRTYEKRFNGKQPYKDMLVSK